MSKHNGPKILLLDIETSYLTGSMWDIWNQNIPIKHIKDDWTILAWAAKWLGDPDSKIIYSDQRNVGNVRNDKKLMKKIWNLMNEADIIITHNGKRFDEPRLNTRFVVNDYDKPGKYRHIDTLRIAKRHFNFTSNSLEYVAKMLGIKMTKRKSKKYPGMVLWDECLDGNKDAFKEMELYNKQDVVLLEAVYKKLIPWDNSINFSVYYNEHEKVCSCGSKEFHKNGTEKTNTGEYQRYRCKQCGAPHSGRLNLLSPEKRKSLRK